MQSAFKKLSVSQVRKGVAGGMVGRVEGWECVCPVFEGARLWVCVR